MKQYSVYQKLRNHRTWWEHWVTSFDLEIAYQQAQLINKSVFMVAIVENEASAYCPKRKTQRLLGLRIYMPKPRVAHAQNEARHLLHQS